MITSSITVAQFAMVSDYLKDEQVKLLISDFNGVLDDYYAQKYTFLRNILGHKYQSHLAALAVFTDTEYIVNRAGTLEASIEKYFNQQDLIFDDATRKIMNQGMASWSLTPEARGFLESLQTPYVIYTSQTADAIKKRLGDLEADIYSRDRTGREKPSVQNLEQILNDYNISPEEACMLGDGLIDDLMPARLMGMKTVLVSPFAHTFHAIS